MIKKTLYFGNPAYLSLKNGQLVIKLPEIEKNDSLPDTFRQQSQVTKPIEDIGPARWKPCSKTTAPLSPATAKACP